MFIGIHKIFMEKQVSIQQQWGGYALLNVQCVYFYPHSGQESLTYWNFR